MMVSVHIGYNLPGYAGQLRLSRAQLCGIFTGAITDWNDPAIRSGNGGVNGAITGTPGRSEPIRVVTQNDGSGATFLLTDHLNAICPGWAAAVSGQTGSGGEVGTGGTGSKIAAFWSKPQFFAAAGDNGSAVAIAANPWTIGYVSPEVVKPAVAAVSQPAGETYTDATGLNTLAVTGGAVYGASPTARLQNRSGNYRNPTLFNAATSLLDTRPPQGAAALNPENWAAAGRVPDPTQPEGYPIAGFTWWSSHTCYFRGDVVSAIRGYWDWHTRYGAPPVPASAQVQRILYSNGFDILQFMPRLTQTDNWNGATRVHMILDPTTQIARAGSGSPSCAGVSPGVM
jgi:phosphate transport system substrate-binding protein